MRNKYVLNTYKYSDLLIGMEEVFEVKVISEMMDAFLKITGDSNPLHINEDYAKSKQYPGCVVYGMLVSAFYSTLAGVYLPGKHSLIHSIEIKMLKPVFVNDTLKIKGKIVECHDNFKMIRVKGSIVNQDGMQVSKAVLQIGVID